MLQTGDRNANAIARTIEALIGKADPKRYQFSVLFLNDDGELGDRFRSAGVRVASAGWSGSLRDAAGAARFAGATRKLEPQIIHFHAGGASVRLIARAATGAKIVAHFHSLRNESGAGRPRSTRGADLTVANSQATAATLKGASPVLSCISLFVSQN